MFTLFKPTKNRIQKIWLSVKAEWEIGELNKGNEGMGVGLRGIGVRMQEIRVGMQGMGVKMRESGWECEECRQ